MSQGIVRDTRDELGAMVRSGFRHPSTIPVLTGAAVGGLIGWLLPFVGLTIGLAIGAGFSFYKRLRP